MDLPNRTRVAVIERRAPSLVVVRIAADVTQTVSDAIQTLDAANLDVTKPVPVMVNIIIEFRMR